MLLLQSAQYPVYLCAVARMVGARQPVNLTAAAAEMNYDAAPADVAQRCHQRGGIVAVGPTFQAVKQRDQRACN